MLDIRNISKRFGDDPPVLTDIDLHIARGDIICLLGPSGCGKTTLLRIIAGLEQADQGRILCEGEDLAAMPVHKRNFGLMFQDFALFPHRTVGENIGFGLRMARWSAAAIEQRSAAMLELISLPPSYAQRTIFELSGGERQRVALARSLAPNPRLLMLDEPLGNLDRGLRESLMLDLRAILKQVGVTAVYVTHDQEEAYAVADELVLMENGRIVQIGAPQAVYAAPATPFVARFLGFHNLLPVTPGHAPEQMKTPLGPLPLPLDAPPLLGPATLLIHPQSATFMLTPAPGSLPATVRTLSFRGDHFDIEVDIEVDVEVNGPTDDTVAKVPLLLEIPTYALLTLSLGRESRADAQAPGSPLHGVEVPLSPGARLYLELDPAKFSLLERG